MTELSEEEGEFNKRIKYEEISTSHPRSVVEIKTVMEIVAEAQHDFYAFINCEPMDWIYHTGEKKQEIEALIKKWFGENK